MKRFKGCLGVFLIFFLGAVFGALFASSAIYAKVWSLIEAGPETVTEFTVQRLRDELKLDSLQKREFQRISDRTRLQLRSLRYRAQPDVDTIVNAAPEFEDCLRIASERSVPVKDVQAAASRAYLDSRRD